MSDFPDETAPDAELSPFTLRRRGYGFRTESPVRYLPVTKDEKVIGYLWASVSGDAAHFVARVDAGAEGNLAEYPWFLRLERAKEEGLTALAALHHWIGAPEHPRAGRIAADATEREAPGLDALHQVARSKTAT
ncbi:hypothetical protein [Actinoallomurus sp. CA-142502]|uniref:hypothetical protein n=1 Tax=Actinoallomurus sp. CA-142502 TaxID=3239885 RepID=UPI003D8D81F7